MGKFIAGVIVAVIVCLFGWMVGLPVIGAIILSIAGSLLALGKK